MKNIIHKYIFLLFIILNFAYSEDINEAMELYMQGELSLLADDIVSAENYFQQALNFSPNNSTILLSLLEINIIKKNFLKIEELLNNKYIDIENLDISYCIKIIDLYKMSNNPNSDNIIDLMIYKQPDNIELKYEKAKILAINENWEELLLLYSGIYIIDENRNLLDRILNIGLSIEDPQVLYNILKYIWDNSKIEIEILELLIQLSYLSNDHKITEQYLEELLSYDQDNEFAIMMLAEINILDQNFIKTISLLKKIKNKENPSLDLYKMLLISYSNTEDYDGEINTSIEIINKFPFDTLGYESLALAYLDTEEYIKAIEVLDKAINIFPEEYYFYYYLGLCYRNNFKNKKAIDYFIKALVINPELKNVMHDLAKSYEIELNYKDSDSLFNILLKENFNDAMIMNDYAYMISERENVSIEDLNLALKLSKDSVSLVPDSSEYLDTIGWIYYKIGEYNKALDYLLMSQSIDKKNSIILEHLGDVYLKLEKYEKALSIYNQIMINNSNNAQIIKKIDLINER